MAQIITLISLVFQINLFPATTLPTYEHRSVSLTPHEDNHDGASLHIINNTNTVTINEFKKQWEIISESNEWFMKIHLNKSWGFNKHFGSIISITFDSPTIGGPQTFNEIIIGLTVPNSNQYIALDLSWNGMNKIIPSCDTSNNPTTSMNNGDISGLYKAPLKTEFMQPNSPNSGIENNQSIAFPMTITLINYPRFSQEHGHYLYTQFTCAGFSSDFLQQCGFQPFDTEKGLDIYFGFGVISTAQNLDLERLIALKSFSIQYTDDQTFAPVSAPTTNLLYTTDPTIKSFKTTVEIKTSEQQPKASDSTLSNEYLGLWIVAILALMTCGIGVILLYCSQHDSKSKKNESIKDISIGGKQLVHEHQTFINPMGNKSQNIMISSVASIMVTPYLQQAIDNEEDNEEDNLMTGQTNSIQ